MVKTTKKLLNFLQSLNKYVQKKTEKEYLFIRRYILFWENENRKGAVKPRPLCTPLGLFLECLTVAGGRLLTCACMLRLFRVERCADGAPWAPWMCDVLAGAGAFVNAAPGLPG